MIRPEELKWGKGIDNVDVYVHLQQLEAYCNEIESKLEMATGTIVMLDDKLTFIEKALDKACEKLAFASNKHCIDELCSFTLNEINRTKEEWKEESMKDE